MRFATYLPYDYTTTHRASLDAYGEQAGKELIYCVPADTIEDFIVGSMIIFPVCAEQLVIFDVKHFYWIDKIQHYLWISDKGHPSTLFNSREAVEWVAKRISSDNPYEEFVRRQRNLDKTQSEFLVPKDRINPLTTFDVVKMTSQLCAENPDAFDWDKEKQEYIEDRAPVYIKGENKCTDLTPERILRNITAEWHFNLFKLNDTILQVAADIYGKQISMDSLDLDIYWKLYNKFDAHPNERRLRKLVNYIKSTIVYED